MWERAEIKQIDAQDQQRIQQVLDAYTESFSRFKNPEFFLEDTSVPFKFDGKPIEIGLLASLEYDSPFDFPYDLEGMAIVWANAVVKNTSFDWGKDQRGLLCIWREGFPYVLVYPEVRFREAGHSSRSGGYGVTSPVVTERFVFECFLSGLEQRDLQPILDVLEESEKNAILNAIAAYRS